MTQQINIPGFQIDDFYLDIQNRQLTRDHEILPLNSKYFDVLVMLIAHRGQLVEKRRIFDEIWDGVIVSDSALTQCIKAIRKQLKDNASNPRYIKTIPKHGYVFIGDAVEAQDNLQFPFSPTDQTTRPYKFLDYYTEFDAGLFFGRDSEIENICSQIISHRSFLLYGRSGVGKSSILRAGLMPELQRLGHIVFPIRSFTNPIHQVAQALRQVIPEHITDVGEDIPLTDLIDQFLQYAPDQSIIIMLDQFEEFFLLLTDESQHNFMEAMAMLMAERTLSIRFVFVLREDMLAEMNHFKHILPEIYHHEYRLKRLSRDQATVAITAPAQKVGCAFDPLLVERLLDDLAEHEDIDPPHLQIVCDTLYDTRDDRNHITETVYEHLGGASQILKEYLARVLRRFNATDLHAVQQILLSLISTDEQRLVLREIELVSRIHHDGRVEVDALKVLIEELVDARVVRRRSQDGESWLELAHECLIQEVSHWLTDTLFAVKQARSLLERALENYRAHQLIIDPDSLDYLYPFLEEIGISSEEANLLTKSLLHRGRSVPDWLVQKAPNAADIIIDATHHSQARVRLHAVESSRTVRNPALNNRLRTLALRDHDLNIRKAASIELADWFGSAVEAILSRPFENEQVSRIQRAISLAILREHNNRLIPLPHISSIMVMIGLVLVRLRRSGIDIIRQGVGGAFGGGASGLVGGLLLGTGLAIARETVNFEVTSMIFVLSSLGAFVGAFGGAGVSFGMITIGRIAQKYSRWWTVVGGALGGAFVGGCANLFSVDALKTLFGQHPTGLTGGLEGALIGAGVALGPVITHYLFDQPKLWHRIFHILIGALGAMCAGILLTIIGGNLFSSSLEIVRLSFAESQIQLEPIAMFFGEGYFGRTTKIALGAVEGLLFGIGVLAGIELFSQPSVDDEAEY
jgi:DNA-binding winged helix-turn-helix (wHTH) protein